jgi:salicylate biosynthesis isochorismate synthase/menaquinone-specific isochorismate synthase
MASLGVALRLSAAGPDRFAGLQQQLAAVPEVVPGIRFTLGFSFNPHGPDAPEWEGFGAADMVLPSVSLIRSGLNIRLVVAIPPGGSVERLMEMLTSLRVVEAPALPDPGSHIVESVPASGDWQEEVADAVGAISDGSFDKVVLARSVLVRSERATDPYDLVHHLGAANPSCYIYATVTGDTAFVGASPELLLSQTGREIQLNPLAGSARRGKGTDDLAVGRELLASAKDRAEHAIVVDDLVSRLTALTSRLDYSHEPSLRRMATVQHLSTEIAGTLRNGVSTFDVLRSVHPTPAVGGNPRSEALAFIDKVEGIDRGWYAGGVGWVSPEYGAQVALALRCALIKGATSRLFAGNGIVAESDPATELIETRLKFQPMLNLLAAT